MILILLTVALSGIAQEKPEEINWYSFEEAVRLNKTKKKKFLIDAYTSWCGYCKKMDRYTFTDKEVIKIINKYFYAVKLDAEQKDTITFDGHVFVNSNPEGKRSSHEFAYSILEGKMLYPTLVYLDENLKRLEISPGYKTAASLKDYLLYYGTNNYQRQTLEEFKKENAAKVE